MMVLLKSRELLLGAVTALLVAVVYLLVPSPFRELEKSAQKAEYKLRGPLKTDSSIVIVYFDNDDIAALGDLPIKRSYYALLVHALHEAGASVIGIDIGLSGVDAEHPEYDALLGTIVGASKNVVVGGYFRVLQEDSVGLEPEPVSPFLERYLIATKLPYKVRWGGGLETPFTTLLGNAAWFGHTNYVDAGTLPLLVRLPGERYLPSFGYALAMARRRAGDRAEAAGTIPGRPNGDVLLNYPGDFTAFRRTSAVAFLRSYDDVKAGRSMSLNVGDLRGTTVIVGIVAEGRGTFVETPFSPSFPSVAMHATFLDDMLHDRLLRPGSTARDAVAALILGLAAAIILTLRKEAWAIAGVAALLFAFLGWAYALFVFYSSLIAVVPAVVSLAAVTIVTLWSKHRSASSQIDEVVRQHEGIAGLLAEKEAALEKLERDLSESIHRHTEARTSQLSDEIRQYKAEIERLRVIADDLRAAEPAAPPTGKGRESFHGMVYSGSGPMSPVVELVKKVAGSNATVLILGESGTGKELIAKAIHEESPRKGKPFVAVNCGALAESLLESEIFGHEKGAFTGAAKEKTGRFEYADGGTIFLDEIGEISEAFQVKLLRVLQDGTFERVGGNTTRHTDVRIIAATNRNLRDAVEQKQFREDLYYRLNVVTIQLPALRERGEDLRILVEHFLESEAPGIRTSETAMDALLRYPWKGNIRELQSVITRGALLARSVGRAIIQVKDLPPELAAAGGGSPDLEAQVIKLMREKEFSRSAISDTADDLGGLNRGTVSEYVRGWVFKTFAESMWSIPATVETIADTRDTTIRNRVRRKVNEYLANAVQYVDPAKSFDEVTALSKPKYKNLPQRYHKYLDDVIATAYKGHWRVDEDWNKGSVD
jgi:transcriptional regulator with GAF, ATPase, and Fis domain